MSIGTNESAVIYVELGISATFLSNDKYKANLSAAVSGINAFLNNAFFNIPAQSDTAFAAATMSNLGLRADVIGQAAYDALLPAYAAYLNSVGVESRGVVVVQLASIVAGLTGDATFGKAATNLVNAANTAFAYSTDAANTTDKAVDVATVPPLVTYFTLTTGTDALTGSALADIFTAITSSQASVATLQATDSIDGAAGDDTLQIDLNSAFTGFTSGTVKNVETIALTNKSATSLEFDATGVTGANKYVLNSTTAAVTLKDVATGIKTIEITGQKGTATAASTFKAALASDAAEISGTADSISLNLNNVGVKTASATTTLAVDVDLASFETINIGSNGTANVISFAAGTAPKTVVATGAGSLDITAVQNGLTSFDASAATGAVTANLTGVTTAASITSIKGGAGKDSFTLELADLKATAAISGGDGTDAVSLTNTASNTVEYTMSGVETLTLVNTGTLNFSGAKTTGLTTVATASTTNAQVNLLTMGATDLTFNSSGTTDESGDIGSDHSGASTVSYAATATQLTAATAITPAADYTFSKSAGALNVNVGPFVATTSSAITANKASSVNVTVDSGKNSSSQEQSQFNSTLTAGEATAITVNATGALGTSAVINAAKATTATIVNGTTAGGLSLVTPKLNSLTVTTSSSLDISQGSEDLTTLETLNVTATAGLVTFAALAKVATVNLSGAGTTSQVTLGDLGANTNAQNLSITASGLKSDLATGALVVGAGYDVTVTANGMTGDVSLGAIAATGAKAKNVSVTASGGKETFGVGNIFATGVVNVDASNTTKAVTVGTVEGASVTVNINGSAAGSGVGNITAKDSANLTYNALDANTETITAATGSTALSVAIQGGILADAITIDGVSTQTAVTVTGDLGGSTDSLTVNSAASTVAQNINISGLANYDAATIRGGSAADTIVGGSGNDNIRGNAGADVMTGGAGDNTFTFNVGHSTLVVMDTITDLKKTDIVIYEGANTAVGTQEVTAAAGVATITNGIATFGLTSAAGKDTLAEVVALVDAAMTTIGRTAFFTYDNASYLFINDDTTTGNFDTVVKLTGLNLDAMVLNFAGSTGITGFGA